MAIDVFALLSESPILLIFTVIGLGYLVAKIRIADIPAGPVIGVLLVGLLFGHLGFSAPPGASSFGFALFIFSVGIQAGPLFFSAFAADGARYVTLACVVAGTAVALSLVLARLVGLEYGFSAGMLAGALTSTPTLAGAQDAVKSGLATFLKVVGKTLKELDLPKAYGCFATGLARASIDLPVEPDLPLQKGDRLEVVGEKDNLRRLAETVGFVERDLEKTDLATFAFGMIAGTLLGLVTLALGEVSIGLGTAGGLLVVGIVIGYLGSVMPTFGQVPAPARYVLMELGLMLFMAGVGLNAGSGVVAALASVGPIIILSGLLVTLLPPLMAYVVGRRLLRMNPALLLGSITGAMTSTPALNVVTEAARSGVPALGYAGTYTFANVLLTFAGALMMRL
ncbi:MAG: hypothetical protein MZV65_12080 [Chromatiales bacterium]|nr:hypothetical protein [Chromatiales bacterium]